MTSTFSILYQVRSIIEKKPIYSLPNEEWIKLTSVISRIKYCPVAWDTKILREVRLSTTYHASQTRYSNLFDAVIILYPKNHYSRHFKIFYIVSSSVCQRDSQPIPLQTDNEFNKWSKSRMTRWTKCIRNIGVSHVLCKVGLFAKHDPRSSSTDSKLKYLSDFQRIQNIRVIYFSNYSTLYRVPHSLKGNSQPTPLHWQYPHHFRQIEVHSGNLHFGTKNSTPVVGAGENTGATLVLISLRENNVQILYRVQRATSILELISFPYTVFSSLAKIENTFS